MGRTQLGNDGLSALCSGRTWPNLTALSLSQNSLDDKAAVMLAESKLFPKLVTLDLYGNPMGDEAISIIKKSPNLTCLRALQIN